MSPSTKLYDLIPHYRKLYDSAVIKNDFKGRLEEIKQKVLSNYQRYEYLAKTCNVPIYFIVCTHYLECNGSWEKHLHNGDPLTGRTVNVPSGRPLGKPQKGVKYSFDESCYDAIVNVKKFDRVNDQSFFAWLWRLELWNGFGYLLYHPEVLNPYLWSGTNHYKKGKYTSDGKFDPECISQQVGCIPILVNMQETFEIKL